VVLAVRGYANLSRMHERLPSAEVDRLLRQREGLRQVIEEISSELELRPLLTHIVRHACELLEAHDGAIGLYDQERDAIRTEAVYRMPEEELGTELPPGVGLAGQVLLHRRPVAFQRYGDIPGYTLKELADNTVVGVCSNAHNAPRPWKSGSGCRATSTTPSPRCSPVSTSSPRA
jgi:GAF domain-containing protein